MLSRTDQASGRSRRAAHRQCRAQPIPFSKTGLRPPSKRTDSDRAILPDGLCA